MGVFKNGVGRPSNETIKKRNIFKGICVLLVLIIIGMTVYILNDKGIINISSKDNKKTVDKKTNNDTTEELDINSKEVTDLFKKYNKFNNGMYLYSDNDSGLLYTYFYQNDSLKKDQIDDRIKFAYSFENLYKITEGNYFDENSIKKFNGSVQDVKNESIKMFGNDFNVNNLTKNNTVKNSVGLVIYGVKPMLKENDITISLMELGDAGSADIYTKIISAKKTNGNLLIENKVMFVFAGESNILEQGVFKTAKNYIDDCLGASCYGLTDKISELPNDNKIKIDDYLDKLDTYRWTFKENTDGSYTFESVEKVK